jgi:hypothetical protein
MTFKKGQVPWNKDLHINLNPGGGYQKGSVPWNTGKKDRRCFIICETCGKQFEVFKSEISGGKWGKRKYCSRECWKKGHKTWNKGIFGLYTGDKSAGWKGGITPVNMKIRESLEYKLWRSEVYSRDNYTCQMCGAYGGDGVKIVAHHIKSFAHYKKERFNVFNGLTLCKACHRKTNNYGGKARRRKYGKR